MSLVIPDNALHIFPHEYSFKEMNEVLDLSVEFCIFINDDLSIGPLISPDKSDKWVDIRRGYKKKLYGDAALPVIDIYPNIRTCIQRNNPTPIVIWCGLDYREQLNIGCILFILESLRIHNLQVYAPIISDKLFNGTIAASMYLVATDKIRQKVELQLISSGEKSCLRDLWMTVCSSNPQNINDFLSKEFEPGHIMGWHQKSIVRRFPNAKTGLNFFDLEILRYVSKKGPKMRLVIGYILADCMDRYDYVGDWYIFYRLKRMVDPQLDQPLLKLEGDLCDWKTLMVCLTDVGKDVLDKNQNFCHINKVTDEVGGIMLSKENAWCYDGEKLVRE